MKKQKTAPAESAVQTEKKGTGIQIDKKTVFGITALLLVIMLLAGVLKYIMSSVVRKFEKKKYLLLAVIVFVCMMMSSVVGVLEESLTLVPLAVAISLALGWDSFVGLGISMVSIAFGYTAATFNPFNVGILQTMADLPLFSGLAYRVLFFVCVYASLVLFLF